MEEMQRTIAREASFTGIGLHTGNTATVTFKPREPDTGLVFVRTDLPGHPRLDVHVDNVSFEDVLRQTAIGPPPVQIRTVEHVLAAIAGLGIDNLVIEVDGGEPPVGDGSARPFVETLERAGIVAQDRPRKFVELTEPVWLVEDGKELAAIPSNRLEITYKIDYDHPAVGIASASFLVTEDIFKRKIAPARTFCFLTEVEQIKKAGLIQGGSLDNSIVIGETAILNEGPLRFRDEIIRHKVLDVIGDFALLGRPLRAHVIAVRSGHAFNVKFIRKLLEHLKHREVVTTVPLCVEQIRNILPHRFPFLLVDRIIELDRENLRAVGLKNVTINEPFFQGHWPQRAVMPGVLLIEAMAQVGGILLLSAEGNRGKLAYLVTVDNVKFRKPVVPGDQVRIETTILRMKSRMGKTEAKCYVDGEVVAECNIVFTLSND